MTEKYFFGNNQGMREITQDVNRTKDLVKEMTGVRVKLKVNRGRNKIEVMEGAVENVYPQIFTFRRVGGEINSFCYSDILSKNVRFFRIDKV